MTLRVGFVSVTRPAFKGDSGSRAAGGLSQLERLGAKLGFSVVAPQVAPADHPATGQRLPTYAVHDAATAAHAARQLKSEGLDFLLIQHTTFATAPTFASNDQHAAMADCC